MTTLLTTDIKSLPFLHRGKVRDIYAVGEDKLLVIQTDRLSAFDVILDDPIPGKGEVLTALSNFWFAKLGHLVPNHITGIDPESVVKRRGRARAGARPRHGGEEIQADGYRGDRARLHHRLGLEGLPADRLACAASRCRRA